jgi:organic radical activating enzyme
MSIIQVYNPQPKDVLRVEFMIGNTCNYECWYCFKGSHEGTHRWTDDVNQLVTNFVHLFDRYKAIGKRKLELHIVGGEPTLWPQLGEFVTEIRQHIPSYITISSNGSRSVRWWKEFGHVFDNVWLSCHHQEADIEHLIAVSDALYEIDKSPAVMVLMDPTAWNVCLKIIEELKTSKYPWDITAMEVMHKTINYTEEQKKFVSEPNKRHSSFWNIFKKKQHTQINPKIKFEDGSVKSVNRNWIVLNKQNDFYGWMCNIGVDSMMIDPAGIITAACRTKLFEQYNIYDKDFVKKFNPNIKSKICDKKNTCMCQPESLLDKFKF